MHLLCCALLVITSTYCTRSEALEANKEPVTSWHDFFWKSFGNKTADVWSKVESVFTEGDEEDAHKVNFYLYTRQNPDKPEPFIFQNAKKKINYRNFNSKRATKILIHGWMAAVSSKFSETLIDAYLANKDYNIIFVDWSIRSRRIYPASRNSITFVANLVSQFIDKLNKDFNVKPESLHLVAHSLGAHIAGVAGRLIRSGTLGRISGLDPALPYMTDNHTDILTTESAKFVDVIHTCGKFLGWFEPLGHIDFYPNEGIGIQPGCGLDVIGRCSHRRAWKYFAESIKTPKAFIGVSCNSWEKYVEQVCNNVAANMGESTPTTMRGAFYLATNSEEPYGRGVTDFHEMLI